MTQALEGVRVLDLCHNGPGLYAGALLGDMGADVIHVQDPRSTVERVGGGADSDYARRDADRRHPAYALNRNKRGIAINLKSETGRNLFYRLVDQSDVVLDGYRPGVMQRLGLDYETLAQRNPRIICCSISGYGQTGPYRGVVGHDVNYVATAGGIAITGERGGRPGLPGFQFADFAGGTMHAFAGILLALMARERTGRGQCVDVAMTDGSLALMASQFSSYAIHGTPPRRGEQATNGGKPYYGLYECADGKWISFGNMEPRFWAALCTALDREDLIPAQDDPARDGELRAWLSERMRAKTRDEWFELLSQREICVGRVLEFDEVEHDPQLRAREMFVTVEAPDGQQYRQVGSAFKLSETPGSIRRLAPGLGQHTAEILGELGYSASDVDRLRQSGAIR